MHLLAIQLTLLAASLPSLTLASLEAGPEPTTTLFSTSTMTMTKTVVAASVTQTLTSLSTMVTAAAPSSSSSSFFDSISIPATFPSSIYIHPSSLPPSSAAPYPTVASSLLGGQTAGSASAPLPSGTGAAAGTGVPSTPSQSIVPFPGAGTRVGAGGLWAGVAGAAAVGLGMLV